MYSCFAEAPNIESVWSASCTSTGNFLIPSIKHNATLSGSLAEQIFSSSHIQRWLFKSMRSSPSRFNERSNSAMNKRFPFVLVWTILDSGFTRRGDRHSRSDRAVLSASAFVFFSSTVVVATPLPRMLSIIFQYGWSLLISLSRQQAMKKSFL